ncbi:ribonuclease H2 subunit C [Aspergillus candidus]|uniref:Ribonuclease H2 subunit C n=1 Tax=Aspergillus candidus TaxID=41067 RepID=A0A2I2FGG9_ASPCN|nr:ribonuclease H2 subunit C [Aspergillus candidus]PLB39721.1 ribonuclease H2 subunit C [Aspergillus candidus]
MFAIQPSKTQSSESEVDSATQSCTPNVLPCRIHHNGSVKSIGRYWSPVADEKDQTSQTAYFRGRKLRGRRVAVPEGYEGVVATPTERTIRPAQNNAVDEAEPEEPVKVLEKQATFQDVMVWGHEFMPAADDPFVRGVEEWVRFAEAMHGSSGGNDKSSA